MLLSILDRYHSTFLQGEGQHSSAEQRYALQAMRDCRSGHYGELQWFCDDCEQVQHTLQPCGHRSCPRCQHHDTSQWLARQQLKLLPTNYFMVTFTLPYELRLAVKRRPKAYFDLLFECATATLKEFVKNDIQLGGDAGMTAVMHTHTRRLDFHPHLHIVIPAGSLNKRRRQWKKLKGDFLFNEFSLAKVFRGKFLAGMAKQGLIVKGTLPKEWVANCKFIGKGLPALKYLARYLYRGVINEKNIIKDDGTHVTFRYIESKTRLTKTRRVKGEDFIKLLLQHVLPKGYRRARDYGYLHGNAKQYLRLIQIVLRVIVDPLQPKQRPLLKCRGCGKGMNKVMFILPKYLSG